MKTFLRTMAGNVVGMCCASETVTSDLTPSTALQLGGRGLTSTLFAIVCDPCYHEDLAEDAQIRASRPKALTVAYVGCLLCCISGRLKTILTCFPEGRSDGRRRINSNEAALLCAFVCTSWPVADIFCASCADPRV